MACRFIAIIAQPSALRTTQEAGFEHRLAAMPGLTVLARRPGFTLAVEGCPSFPCGAQSHILGTVFRRGEQQAVTAFSLLELERILESRGSHLIDACWGPYIAFLDTSESKRNDDGHGRGDSEDDDEGNVRGDDRIDIIRAPWGELPCYRYSSEGISFLASDIDLLVSVAGYRPGIDWKEVLNRLAHGPLHHERTCLVGIDQIPAGERLSIGWQEDDCAVLWSPWSFAAAERQIAEDVAPAALVRSVAQTCIAARASQFDSVLLTLSGGLDSSIVAACLAASKSPLSAINLVTRDAIGDESSYARHVSETLGFPLAERLRDVSRIDITRSGAAGRPYPCVHAFFVESRRLAGEVARETGARTFFNGAGGDNIFCSLQSGAPAADRLLVEGPGKGFLRSVSDISQLAPASIPAVMLDAIARAWPGRPPLRHRPMLEHFTEKACALVESRPAHPWAQVPSGIPPGKAMHVWMLAHFRTFIECHDARSEIPAVSPLLSQPLVEACLTIPSWMWFRDGHNRVVARDAFADLLPDDILMRRSKGTPGSFNFEIFEAHRATIRALIEDGQLARQGLIDLPGTLAILEEARPPTYASMSRILAFADVEAWAANWSASPG